MKERHIDNQKGSLRALLTTTFLASLLFTTMTGTAFASAPPSWLQAHPPFHLRIRRISANQTISPNALTPQGLTPAQIKSIYNLPSTGGSGTIALIEAYDNPNAESDLGTFDTQFSLAPCTTANTCFTKHQMSVSTSTNSGWTVESSLDVEWAHAIAPNAKILLVEAQSSSDNDLIAAVDYARNQPGVVAISMSWGSAEFSGESSDDYHFVSPYGAVFFASTGDTGSGVAWPAVSTNVVAVGGTTLNFTGNTFTSETAWSGSGGGLSKYVNEPSYQLLYGVPQANGFRAIPDVSYDADPNSGFSIYDSTGYQGQSGWLVVGGTSAGAPQWAAIDALASTTNNTNLYAVASSSGSYASDFRDITSGTNGSCGFDCTAQVGYDYVTGLGSPLTDIFNTPPTYAHVTPATGAVNVSIDTTSYAGGTATWTTLTGPVIQETSADQITSGVYTLTLPSGWQFNTTHNVNITTGGGTSLSVASTTITPNASSLSFDVTAVSATGTATLTLSGIQVQPTGTSSPSIGTITYSGPTIAGADNTTSFGTLSTTAGASTTVNVETVANGTGTVVQAQNLASGSSTTVYTVTRDQFGNFVANAPAVWSLVSKTGGVANGDLSASSSQESATLTGTLDGSCKIHASIGGLASVDSGLITVVPGTITSLSLSPQSATTTTGTTVTYSVQGFDTQGNGATTTASSTFSISSGAGGSFSGSTYAPQNTGNWIVSALYGSLTGSSTLTVIPQVAQKLIFSTEPTSTAASSSLTTTVSTEDSLGNLDTNYSGIITLDVYNNPGLLQGVTSTPAVAGVAAFNAITINQPGSGYVLDATAAGLTSTTSSAFDMTAAPSVLPAAGTYTSNQSVVLSAAPGSNGLYYTVDGSTPDCTVPTGISGTSSVSISVASTETISARSCYAGAVQSSVGSFAYTLQCTVPSVSNGSVASYPACTITCNVGYSLSGNSCVAVGGGSGGGGGGGAPISASAISLASTSTTVATNTVQVVSNTAAALASTSNTVRVPAATSLVSTNDGVALPSFSRNLWKGMTDPLVRSLQELLNHLGFTIAQSGPGSPGDESDYFGAATQRALIAFQSAHAITPASGYLGPATRALISTMTSSTTPPIQTTQVASNTPSTPTPFTRNLQLGSQGSDVASLQQLLITAGYSLPAGATGYFGTQTREALMQYQGAHGITPASGYFGPATRAFVAGQ